MSKSRAAIIAVLSPCLAYGVVVALTERIRWDADPPAGKERRAALALRDNVIPFQKWGSKQFTWPYLNRYYEAAWFFTQSDSEDCKEAFLAALNAALQSYSEVDLFLLAHTNQFIDWVAELPAERRRGLRLVYNTGCHDSRQGSAWLGQGAQAYVGHPGESASPVFYFFFLRRWTRGVMLQEAVEESNRLMRGALDRAEFLSFGKINAARVYHESKALRRGDERLRIGGAP